MSPRSAKAEAFSPYRTGDKHKIPENKVPREEGDGCMSMANGYTGNVIKKQRVKNGGRTTQNSCSNSATENLKKITNKVKVKGKRLINVDGDLEYFTNLFISNKDYTDRDVTLLQPSLSIAFVGRAIDAYNPLTTFGPCRGLMLAIAKVFGEYGEHISATCWDSLFTYKVGDATFRYVLLHLICEVYVNYYDYRLVDEDMNKKKAYGCRRPYNSSNKYKDIRDRLDNITTTDTWQRKIFARFLLKLCDALYGSRSAQKRRDVLGNRICVLGKLTDDFPEHDTWKKPLLVPSDLQNYFLDALEPAKAENGDDEYNSDTANDTKNGQLKHTDKISKSCICDLGKATNALAQLKETKLKLDDRTTRLIAQLQHSKNKLIEIDRKIGTTMKDIEDEKHQISRLESHTDRAKPKEKMLQDTERVLELLRSSNRSREILNVARNFIDDLASDRDVIYSWDHNKDNNMKEDRGHISDAAEHSDGSSVVILSEIIKTKRKKKKAVNLKRKRTTTVTTQKKLLRTIAKGSKANMRMFARSLKCLKKEEGIHKF